MTSRHIDMMGQIFSNLTVKNLSHIDQRGNAHWNVTCVCGNVKTVSRSQLVHSKIKSCGCKQYNIGNKNSIFTGYEDISGNRWKSIRAKAKSRGITLSVTIKEIWEVYIKQNKKCALSGVPISFDVRYNYRANTTASLDRIDSKQGYHISNIQWVHKDVNAMKMSMPEDKFVEWCHKISNYKQSNNI